MTTRNSSGGLVNASYNYGAFGESGKDPTGNPF
jgi:hypothetical protein